MSAVCRLCLNQCNELLDSASATSSQDCVSASPDACCCCFAVCCCCCPLLPLTTSCPCFLFLTASDALERCLWSVPLSSTQRLFSLLFALVFSTLVPLMPLGGVLGASDTPGCAGLHCKSSSGDYCHHDSGWNYFRQRHNRRARAAGVIWGGVGGGDGTPQLHRRSNSTFAAVSLPVSLRVSLPQPH